MGEKWEGVRSGARKIEGKLGKVSGGKRKSHGGVNRRLEGNQWDWDVGGRSGVWGIFFSHNYLLCYFFGQPK